MKPSKGTPVFENTTSIYWFDEKGVLCAIFKKSEPQTLEQAKESIKEFKKIVREKKVCMMIDITNSPESSKEVRDYIAEEFPKFIKAIAMISGSALGKMLANLFFNIKKQPYPTRMFNNERDARDWLVQYT